MIDPGPNARFTRKQGRDIVQGMQQDALRQAKIPLAKLK
jgi:hypothetical protein